MAWDEPAGSGSVAGLHWCGVGDQVMPPGQQVWVGSSGSSQRAEAQPSLNLFYFFNLEDLPVLSPSQSFSGLRFCSSGIFPCSTI